jgi:hypothetical protein
LPDAIVNTRRALGPDDAPSLLRRLLGHEALNALCTRMLGAAYERVHVSLPRSVRADSASDAFRGAATVLELGSVPFAGGLSVVLGHPGAHTLVERILGGTARIPSAEPPSAGECGVLGYGAARVLSALESAFVLRDVRALSREALREASVGQVLWPLVLESSLDTLELGLLVPKALAHALSWQFRLRLSLLDDLDPAVLATLEPGDVLVSDTLSLLAARDGLHGAGFLSVDGVGEAARATLQGAMAHGTGERTACEASVLELALAERHVSLAELADIVSGQTAAFTALRYDAVELRMQGQPLAWGELGTLRGALCVRISRRESAA